MGEVVAQAPSPDSQSPDEIVIQTQLLVPASEPMFGDPYRPDRPGARGRVPIAATIDTGLSEEVYHLIVDYDLADIQELVAAYEEIGQTWESHIAWLDPDGNAAFITRLRFDEDAAFTRTVSGDLSGAPIVQAVNGDNEVLVNIPDYRQEPSILAIRTVDPVGWGLVVKADYAEAMRPFTDVRTLWFGAIAAATVAIVAILWFASFRIGRRLARFAKAAKAVGRGDFSRRINDPYSDELGQVAAEFDRAADVLSEAIDEKARFVATVSHELRTPLAAVIGMSDLLANRVESLTEEEKASTAREISIQSNELGSLVDDLLVVASSRNGSLVVDPIDLYVCDIVKVLMQQLPSELVDKIEVEVSETLPATADWKRTKQILRNLLTNAHKYGGDRIRLSGVRHRDSVSVAVSDNGHGVDAELEERIFLAFQRGDHNSSDSVGLGLNIARELAQRMGGSLEYERSNGWTAFTLTLPAADMEALTPVT